MCDNNDTGAKKRDNQALNNNDQRVISPILEIRQRKGEKRKRAVKSRNAFYDRRQGQNEQGFERRENETSY